MLFCVIIDCCNKTLLDSKIMSVKELASEILDRKVKSAIPVMNALLQSGLSLQLLWDCGFTEDKFKKFS